MGLFNFEKTGVGELVDFYNPPPEYVITQNASDTPDWIKQWVAEEYKPLKWDLVILSVMILFLIVGE